MQVTETSSEGLQRAFKVVVDAGDIDARVETRLHEVGRDVRLPGFRPGKVPMKILKQRFGQSVMAEVVEGTVRDRSAELLQERGLRPAGQPNIEITAFEEGKDLEFDVAVDVLPDIETVDLATVELERLKVDPPESEIDASIERMAKNLGGTEPLAEARPIADGDVAVIDFVGRIDGEPFDGGSGTDFSLEIGSGTFIPGFEEQLIGKSAGESATVTVEFPDDYGSEALAGKKAEFACDIKEVRVPVAPVIDDELAKKMGVDSLEELRTAVRDQLAGEYARMTREHMKRQLLDKLADAHEFEVPPGMLDGEFQQIWQQVEEAREKGTLDADDVDKPEDELKEQYRAIARRRVRLGLVLSDIGEKNGLSVGQDEINRAIMEHARRFPGQEQQVVDFYRDNPEAQMGLHAPLFEDKVVDFIFEIAKIEERAVPLDELLATPDDAAGDDAPA